MREWQEGDEVSEIVGTSAAHPGNGKRVAKVTSKATFNPK